MDTKISDKLSVDEGGGEERAELRPMKDGPVTLEVHNRTICPVSEGHDDVEALPAEKPPVKIVKDPGMPSKDEYDEHMVSHMPFRAWCPFCVQGKAGEDPHFKQKVKQAGDKPTLCLDYKAFGQESEEGDEEGKSTVLVMRDTDSISTFVHVVEQKGRGDGWIVDKLIDDIASLGYVDVLIKGDGEPALVQVMENIKQKRSQNRTIDPKPEHLDWPKGGLMRILVD